MDRIKDLIQSSLCVFSLDEIWLQVLSLTGHFVEAGEPRPVADGVLLPDSGKVRHVVRQAAAHLLHLARPADGVFQPKSHNGWEIIV